MASKEFAQHLEWASKVVATWPEWKQNLLGKSIAMAQQNNIPRLAAPKCSWCKGSGCILWQDSDTKELTMKLCHTCVIPAWEQAVAVIRERLPDVYERFER